MELCGPSERRFKLGLERGLRGGVCDILLTHLIHTPFKNQKGKQAGRPMGVCRRWGAASHSSPSTLMGFPESGRFDQIDCLSSKTLRPVRNECGRHGVGGCCCAVFCWLLHLGATCCLLPLEGKGCRYQTLFYSIHNS